MKLTLKRGKAGVGALRVRALQPRLQGGRKGGAEAAQGRYRQVKKRLPASTTKTLKPKPRNRHQRRRLRAALRRGRKLRPKVIVVARGPNGRRRSVNCG